MILLSLHWGHTEQVKGGFFGKQALQKLLAQEDCVGIRFHFGANADGIPVIVMVGVDKFGAEMFFGQLMEMSAGCPPFCGYDTILNSGVSVEFEHTFDAAQEV